MVDLLIHGKPLMDSIYLVETNKTNQWLVALSEITVAVWLKGGDQYGKQRGQNRKLNGPISKAMFDCPSAVRVAISKWHFFNANDSVQMKELPVVG